MIKAWNFVCLVLILLQIIFDVWVDWKPCCPWKMDGGYASELARMLEEFSPMRAKLAMSKSAFAKDVVNLSYESQHPQQPVFLR